MTYSLVRRLAGIGSLIALSMFAAASPDSTALDIALAKNGKPSTKSAIHSVKSGSKRSNKARALPVLNLPSASGNIFGNVIEIEQGTQANGSTTDLYPRVMGALDPILAIFQFPKDALASFLTLTVAPNNTYNPKITNALIQDTQPAGYSPAGYLDWVKDTLPNNDAASLSGGIATGILDGQSGTLFSGAKRGHWNGVRLVDGIAGAELDQFIKGGKEDDTSTWIIGSGSIGSSKYDATQVFIANTSFKTTDLANFPTGQKNMLFFAMERRGNNGTTAFDFEFNQKPPLTEYVPDRSDGDVLFTFEMNGSGSSGSAVPHIYVYKNGNYLNNEVLPNSLPAARRAVSDINQVTTPSSPWGFVNDKGVWTIGQIPVFSVAEAAVPFGVDFLTNVSGCGGSAYVQVRTRSSVTNTSDLKDTTKFFKYIFGGPHADLQLQTDCTQKFQYSAAGSHDSTNGSNLTYDWSFTVPAGVTLSSSDVEFGPDGANKYKASFTSDTVRDVQVNLPVGTDYADITVKLKVTESGGCFEETSAYTVRVWRVLDASASMSAPCSPDFAINYSVSTSGGKGPLSYSWEFYKVGTPDSKVGTSTSASGVFKAPSAGTYYGIVVVKDTADSSSDSHVIAKTQCSVSKQTGNVTTYPELTAAPTLAAPCSTDFAINYDAHASGGNPPLSYSWKFYKKGTPDVQVGTKSDASGTFKASSAGTYYAVLEVTDTADNASGKAACKVTKTTPDVNAYAPITGTATLTAPCSDTYKIDYSSTSGGGNPALSYSWKFYKKGTPDVEVGTSTTSSGTFNAPGKGDYYGVLTIKDTADAASGKAQCSLEKTSNTVTTYDALSVTPALSGPCDGTLLTYSSTVTGGDGSYTYAWKLMKKGTPDVEVTTFSNSGGTYDPAADGTYYATLEVTDGRGCKKSGTTADVTVALPMNPQATKFAADGTNLTVTLKVTYHAPATVQWQKFVGGAWVNVSGGTADTLVYSSFETDDPSPVLTNFTVGSGNYKGKVYTMKFRAITTRTLNGGCTATSNEVTVTKIIGVDP